MIKKTQINVETFTAIFLPLFSFGVLRGQLAEGVASGHSWALLNENLAAEER